MSKITVMETEKSRKQNNQSIIKIVELILM